jgi:hypothetical protein
MSFSLAIFPVLISIVLSAPIDTDTQNCIENYLKAMKLLTKEFGNDEGISSSCNFMIPLIKKEIYRHLEIEMMKDGDASAETASCTIDKLSDKNFVNLVLAFSIYEEEEGTSRITEEKRNKSLSEITKKMNKEILLAMFHCKIKNDLLFQKSNITADDDFSPEELFCIRKYVVEKKLINSAYKIDVNPNKIDIKMIDCEEFNPAIRQTIEDFLKDMILDDENSSEEDDDLNSCVLKAIASENIIDHAMAVKVIHEIELTKDQKKVEKERINEIVINFMKVLTLTCFL